MQSIEERRIDIGHHRRARQRLRLNHGRQHHEKENGKRD
jgi:hypothetical protein